MATLLILGAAGAVGSALSRKLGAQGHNLRLVDRSQAELDRLAAELGGSAQVVDLAQSDPSCIDWSGVDVAIDAAGPLGRRDLRWAEAALNAGADWLDYAESRERALAIGELDALAQEQGRVALSAAGTFCGLTEPFVREAIDDLVRVNEVLFGLVLGTPQSLGPGSFESFVDALQRPVRMLIGGEWTEREPFGDVRAFPHPAPFGDIKSGNLDGADLEVFTVKGYKAASVRISLAVTSGFKRRMLMRLSRKARAGKLSGLQTWPIKLRKWAGSKSGESCLSMAVRGINPQRLPQESRLALVAPAGDLSLVTTPVELLVPLLVGDQRPEPGARPCTRVLEAGDLLQALEQRGVRALRGDLGGWRGSASSV